MKTLLFSCLKFRYPVSSPDPVYSLHGHWNHSLAEALVDDWIFDVVGEGHQHDIIYPGQTDTEMDCDFVLSPPTSDQCPVTSDIQSTAPLWIEYAGLWSKRDTKLARRYRGRMKKKRALARKAGINLVVITPDKLKKQQFKIWEEMVSKAPWLKERTKAGLRSPFLERLGREGIDWDKDLGLGSREKVVRVVDGDTFYAEGRMKAVRLARVNTPEKGEKGFEEAKKALEALILGKEVVVFTTAKDVYERYVAQVRIDSKSVNDLMKEYKKGRN